MPLHIAIDARRIRDFGIGTYIRSLAHALGEVDRVNRASLGAGAAEGAGLKVNGALNATVVELAEDRLAAFFLASYLADLFAEAAVDAVLRDDVR